MALENIFVKLDAIYKELVALKKESEDLIAAAKKQLDGLAVREKAVSELESATKALAEAKALKDEAVKKLEAVEEAQVQFENRIREAEKKLSDEATKLQPLRDLEKDLKQREMALVKEKEEYKERIKKELVAHLKAGKE